MAQMPMLTEISEDPAVILFFASLVAAYDYGANSRVAALHDLWAECIQTTTGRRSIRRDAAQH